MNHAVEFLANLCGNRLCIAGNAPIGSIMGKMGVLKMPIIESTEEIKTAIAHQSLRQKAYLTLGHSPKLQATKNKSGANQQYTHTLLNAVLNDILVFSGNIGDHSPEIRSELDEAAIWHGAEITSISWPEKEILRLELQLDGESRVFFCNYSNKKKTFWENQTSIELRPFETLTF